MNRTPSARVVGLLLVLNVAVTATFVAVVWYGFIFTVENGICAGGGWSPFADCLRPAPEKALEAFQGLVWFAESANSHVPLSVWFYASFLTSVWAVLYAGSWATVRAAGLLGIGLDYWRRLADIEEKPIRSLGLAAMLITTVAYWVLVVVRMSFR